jgi:hypothetical protein
MPGIVPLASSRILERLVLEALRRESDVPSVCEQQGAVRRDEMRHWPALPHMSV